MGERSSSLLFYSLWGKDMFRKPSFRWLNIQIAPLPMAPRSPPSSRVWLCMWRDEVMLHSSRQCWEASFPAPQPQCFIRAACLWCARNMEDAGLSASCQLGNYPASLPGAAEATEPTRSSMAQQLHRWRTRLLLWNVGLSYHSLVNDFIQAGWGHQRPGNKGAALCS